MTEPFILKENKYMVIDAWTKQNPKLIAGFTTKNGGVSQNEFQTLNAGFHVHDHLKMCKRIDDLLADNLSFPLDACVGAEQTHETHIQKVFRSDGGKGAKEYEY